MSNVYNIGVRMTMYENASPILSALASQFMHLHHHIDRTTAASRRFQTAIAGAVAAFAGGAMVRGVAHMVDEGAKLVSLQNQMVAAGWKLKEVEEAKAEAYRISAKYNSIGVYETMKMTKELAPVLGDRHHAVELSEKMARFYVTMQGALGSDHASRFTKQINDAIRASELSGNVLDPARFDKYLDGMAKTLKAFSGTLTPSDYFMATKYGRASAMNWNDEFTNEILPTLMQELASSAGTGLMTLYQAVVGGRMKKRSIAAFDDYGLIDRSKLNPDTDLTPEGQIKRLQPGSFVGSRMLMENPYQWVHETLIPAMLNKGTINQAGLDAIKSGKIKDGVGKEAGKALTEVIAVMFGDRTAQGVVDAFALQWKKFERDRKLIKEAMGRDEGTAFFNEKDYSIAKAGTKEQWHNLMQTLGGPGVEMATKALQGLNAALAGMTTWAAANPKAVQVGLAAMAGMGAALTVIGTAMVGLAVAGFVGTAGVIAAGIAGVAVSLGALAMMNWDGIKNFIKGIREWMVGAPEKNENGGMVARKKSIVEAIAGIINEFIGQISTIAGQVAGSIQAMAAAIAAKINAAISSISERGRRRGTVG